MAHKSEQLNEKLPNEYTPKIGIIDDDPIASICMSARLQTKFPKCTIDVYREPEVVPMLDAYFVDNDFNGQEMAINLLKGIRQQNPNALVIVMSSKLCNKTLKELMNGGCNAVYDKKNPQESEIVFEVLENYLQVVTSLKQSDPKKPLGGILVSIKELLHEWNARLNKASA